jgi:hypothetical protein
MASTKSLLETGEPITVTGLVKQKPTNASSSVQITISGFAFGEYFRPSARGQDQASPWANVSINGAAPQLPELWARSH